MLRGHHSSLPKAGEHLYLLHPAAAARLAVTAEVTVSSKDNLTGRMLLPGRPARERRFTEERHHRFTGQVMHGGTVVLRYPQTFSGLILAKGVKQVLALTAAFQGALRPSALV